MCVSLCVTHVKVLVHVPYDCYRFVTFLLQTGYTLVLYCYILIISQIVSYIIFI